jgi:hypothetical protein
MIQVIHGCHVGLSSRRRCILWHRPGMAMHSVQKFRQGQWGQFIGWLKYWHCQFYLPVFMFCIIPQLEKLAYMTMVTNLSGARRFSDALY